MLNLKKECLGFGTVDSFVCCIECLFVNCSPAEPLSGSVSPLAFSRASPPGDEG